MSTKQIYLSSSGLKNVVLNQYQDEDFVFAFGEQEIQMKSFFAEFISPVVSHLHQTDPTINKINFGEQNSKKENKFNEFCKSILTSEIISHIVQISSGFSIEINEKEATNLQFLSILLGNDELHKKLNEFFPPKYSEENLSSYLKSIEYCYHFSQLKAKFDLNNLFSFVSGHFDELNKDDFLRLPRTLQHEIITHPNLQIESEDSLFDIIIEIIERKEKNEEIDDVLFLESIEFTRLSEDRLHTFFEFFDYNDMNGTLWNKLVGCFFKKQANKAAIVVGGYDGYHQLGENPNNKGEDDVDIICPPLNLSLNPSSLLSYSTYGYHSVLVTRNGSLLGIGDNSEGCICSTLEKAEISQFTEFSIRDNNGVKLTPLSAVCCWYSTLYMFSKNEGGRQLVYCDKFMNNGKPVFLNIDNKEPVALFGGNCNTAAISDKGEVIFINCDSVKNSSNSCIAAVSLPNGEKASSVACLEDCVFVLSSKGHVFSSSIKEVLKFSAVSELAGEEIVCLSGTFRHCLAVNKEGRVFGYGSNSKGRLGLGKGKESVSSFTEISSLKEYKIRSAYAGSSHSLFVTYEGKLISFGNNNLGQLLTGNLSEKIAYTPKETTILDGATFCIAGDCIDAVFIGSKPPPNTPNMRIT